MHLESLSIFCDVVRRQSFSQAAAAHSVSQSAASQAVRQIEQRLGVLLIDRSTRPWRLTPEGKLFFQGCQEIVERYHELEDAVQRRQHPSGYTVRVASIYSVSLHDLTGYVDRFQALAPGADVDIAYMHPDQVYERILSDQSDLGLISYAHPRRGLTAIPWKRQTMAVACPPGHRFARLAREQGGLLPRDLARESFVTFDRGLPVRREIDRFLRRHEVDMTVVAEFDNIENIKQAVEDGAGVAILPVPTLRQEVRRHALVTVPFRPSAAGAPLVRPLSIVHRRKRRLNPAVTEFIKLLCAGDDAPEAARPPQGAAASATAAGEAAWTDRPRAAAAAD